MKEFVEKVIGRLEEIYDRNDKAKKEAYKEQEWERFDFFTHRNEGIYIAMAIINKLAEEYSADTSQKSANGWIPCSERLPEVDVYVLCQGNHSMFIACVDGFDNKWRDCHFITRTTVIAWHPLPQPYKPQKNEWKDAVMKHFTNVE